MDPATILGFGIGSSVATSALSLREGKRNRKFQRDMSNTAHQREMADLRLAGLNPILTGKYGGSSTPPGAMGTPQQANLGPAVQASAVAQQKQLIASQSNLNQANSAKALVEAAKIKSETLRTQTETHRTKTLQPHEVNKLIADTKLSNQNKKLAKQNMLKAIQDTKISTTKAKTGAVLQSITPDPKDVTNALKQYWEYIKLEYKKGDIPLQYKNWKRVQKGRSNLRKILNKKRREKGLKPKIHYKSR